MPPRPVLRWRIYYGDESTIDSSQCDVYDLPVLNVQVAACHTDDPEHSTGLMPIHRKDYYWWEPSEESTGGWGGGDLFGLFDYLMRPGPRKVLFGRTIETETYKRIIKRACEDRELMRS